MKQVQYPLASDWRGKMMAKIRTLIDESDSEIVEEAKYKMKTNPAGVLVWYKDGMISTGETYKEHLRLGFSKGNELKKDDPKGLINAYRAIILREGDKLNEAAFKKLIQAAVVLNQTGKKKPVSKTKNTMNKDIKAYNNKLGKKEKAICEKLMKEIDAGLKGTESKIWHRNPVWFLDGNPVVGYANLKDSVQLLFWSGESFDEDGLENEGKFKAAQKRYTDVSEIKVTHLKRWLKKSKAIQWDYKNIVKHKGKLVRIKTA